MNIAPLRKTILKETAIFTALIMIFGIAIGYLSVVSSDLKQKKDTALRAANQLLSERQIIDRKFTSAQANMGIYQESEQWMVRQGLFLDSQAVRDLFNYYQAPLFLKRMTVELQPIVDVTDNPRFTGKTLTVTKSTGRVVIDAITDEDVYRLIRIMQNELPGFIKVTSLTLTKREPLTKQIIDFVRRQGAYVVINGEMTFDWYGLKSPDASSPINRYQPRKVEEPKPADAKPSEPKPADSQPVESKPVELKPAEGQAAP